MSYESMLEKFFTVVGCEYNQCVFIFIGFFKISYDPLDLVIDKTKLAKIIGVVKINPVVKLCPIFDEFFL